MIMPLSKYIKSSMKIDERISIKDFEMKWINITNVIECDCFDLIVK